MNFIIQKFKERFRNLLPGAIESKKSLPQGSEIVNVFQEDPIKFYPPYRIYNTKIGKYTYISERSIISNTSIGRFCSIGPGLLCGWGIHPLYGISTNPMFYSILNQNGYSLSKVNKIEERKDIIIGNDVFIGANVTILDGVEIGDGAVIGAGTVVNKDVPPYAVVSGSPSEVRKFRFSDEQIKALLKIKWWNWPDELLPNIESDFFDVDKFISKHSI